MRTTIVVSLMCLVSVGCNEAAPPPQAESPFKPVANVTQLMNWIMDPAADVLWQSVATIITEEGTTEVEPKTDEEWAVVRNAAAMLVESGNLLMVAGRVNARASEKDWQEISRGLIDVSTIALRAAEEKDKEKLFNVGSDIYNVCTSCHQKYIMMASE